MTLEVKRFRRTAVLGSIIALVVFSSAWTIWCLGTAVSLKNEIETGTALLLKIQDRLEAVGAQLPGDVRQAGPEPDVSLPGETADIAGATLQKLVTEKIKEAGGDVVESGREDGGTEVKEEGSIYLRVAFAGDIRELQRILFALEGGKPALLVRQLTIETTEAAAEGPQESPKLRAVMLVGGQWEGAR